MVIKQSKHEIEIAGDRGAITLEQVVVEDVAFLRWWEDEISGFTMKLPGWVGRALDQAIRRSGGRTITLRLDKRSIDQLGGMIEKAVEKRFIFDCKDHAAPYLDYEEGKGLVDD